MPILNAFFCLLCFVLSIWAEQVGNHWEAIGAAFSSGFNAALWLTLFFAWLRRPSGGEQ